MNLQFITRNEEIKEQVALFVKNWESDLLYFNTRTSGSTGTPKTIRIEKKHAVVSARATIDFLQLQPSDQALLCLSIHTIGGKMMVVRSILHSMDLYVSEPQANPLKNTNLQPDFIAIAPIQLTTILQETPERLKTIRNILIGGGVISEDVQQLLKQHQITVYQTFGMTETVSHIALRKAGFEQEDCYTTLDHVTVSEKNGRLCIHAPLIGIKELVTNDSAEILNDRQFKWLGRTDLVINSGGIKIQVEALERDLQEHIPGKFFIHAKKDSKFGEKVVLVIEGQEQEEYTRKGFYSFLENNYHIPKEIAFIRDFILTPSHKINRIATFDTILDFKQIR